MGRKANDIVVVELFSGRGEIAKIGSSILNSYYITIDVEEKRKPAYVADIGKWSKLDTASLKRAIGNRKVVLWASPPCEQYSAMNTTGIRNLELADDLVKMAFTISKKINAWAVVFENPATGMLHTRPIMTERLEKKALRYRYTVSYCQYGHPVRKKTHLWSNRDLSALGFNPLSCDPKTCRSTYYNCITGQHKHLLHYDDFHDYNARISVPPQLVSDVFKAIKAGLDATCDNPVREEESSSDEDDTIDVDRTEAEGDEDDV